MSGPGQPVDKPVPDLNRNNTNACNTDLSSGAKADESAPGSPKLPKKLSPEEQMALYEKELKEEDWGHQPC